MALLNTWASQQDPSTLSPLDKLLNNYIQSSNAPAAYLMRGDAKGLFLKLQKRIANNLGFDPKEL